MGPAQSVEIACGTENGHMTLKRIFAFLTIGLLTGSTWLGCTVTEECTGACACTGSDCNFACTDTKACNLTCSDGANCSLECPSGSCNVTCTAAESCDLSCPGGSCNLKCTGAKSCTISDCKGSCNLECGGADTCSSSCTAEQSCNTSK